MGEQVHGTEVPHAPELCVVGAGPAGLAAATLASECGLSTVLVDLQPRPGGQIWRHGPGHPPPPVARRWLARFDRSGARFLGGRAVTEVEAGGGLSVETAADAPSGGERGAHRLRLHPAALLLATGARERFLPFPGWTVPGVLGVGGAQALMKTGLPLRGKRVVVSGSGPLLLEAAASFVRDGASLVALAEQAPGPAVRGFAARLLGDPGKLWQATLLRAAIGPTRYRTGSWIRRAEGEEELRAVVLTDGRREWRVECDYACVAFGLLAEPRLGVLAGCELDETGALRVDGRQETSVPGVFAAGEVTGVGGVDLAVLEGQVAALEIAARSGDGIRARGPADRVRRVLRLRRRIARHRRFAERLEETFVLRPEVLGLPDDGTIVCRCEDVTFGALRPRWTMRQAKLFTRVGMGPCQGRVCGPALESLLGWREEIPRPPIHPVRVGSLAEAGVDKATGVLEAGAPEARPLRTARE